MSMFLILHEDKPIYEYNFIRQQKLQTYFIIHASLDSIEYTAPKRRELYLGQLKTDQVPIFCFINNIGLRFLLVCGGRIQLDKKLDQSINNFFVEANKQLAYVLMNPLYKQKDEIKSGNFEDKIKKLAQEYLKQIIGQKKR